MPEGPEIKRSADRIGKAIIGKPIERVFFAFEHLKKYQEAMKNQVITVVKPRGKALLMFFENDLIIYSHNQLYGRWYIKLAGNYPKTNRSLRLAIHTPKKSALLYSASDIEVLKPRELQSHPFLRKLGPDVLDEETTKQHIEERLRDRKYSGRQLGTLLLDQHFVAGLGNYLRCEILFSYWLEPRD